MTKWVKENTTTATIKKIQNFIWLSLDAKLDMNEPDPERDGRSPPVQFPEILAYKRDALSVPKSVVSSKFTNTSSNPCWKVIDG